MFRVCLIQHFDFASCGLTYLKTLLDGLTEEFL